MKIKALIPLLFLGHLIYCQCKVTNQTFNAGEQISYKVYYNLGFIWLDAGWAQFDVKPSFFRGKKVLHLDSRGETHPNYDWIFKVRDRYQSFINMETILPYWFYRQNYEDGFEVENQYYFHHDKNLAYTFTKNTNKPYSEDTVKIKDCTLDLLSLIYYARNIPFEQLSVNEKFPVNCIIDNELYDLYIRYLGTETIKDRNGVEYKCFKCSALLVEGTMFKGGEDMFIWITQDKNRIPVLIKAKILVGSVKAYQTGHKNLRHPVNAIINNN